ncbi:large subunit GTPase 1 [Nematocida minor]|uniref:large subunit GTPase 1 n=1 Tax=Nematocida minor TaxID=1912983 RepID=UPI00221E3ED7|nr:large subunit GTPase 1 [Nematocida minor]KAI5189410.1 large subunit GTPase 1 [Nematocida minor]
MKTKYEWGKLVIKDKRMNKPQKENKSLKSVLETTEVDSLVEAAEIIEYDFSQNTSIKELTKIEASSEGLRIPEKPKHQLDREDYKNEERKVFNAWKLNMNAVLSNKGTITPYERNLNVWRQLWFTLETNDLIVQIVDARNPLLFYTEDIVKASPNKMHHLLLNKADLLTEEQKRKWSEYFADRNISHTFYSTLTSNSDELLEKWKMLFPEITDRELKIGMIGYPNVGKSSTINSLFKKKVVQTSIIPGKTKNIQTMKLDGILLCDCPGLVFPTFVAEKSDLILNGILSLDHTRDVKDCLALIIERVGVRRLCYLTKVKEFVNDSRKPMQGNYVHWLKKSTGCIEEGKLIKGVVKEYIEGSIKYVHPPPNTDECEFNKDNHHIPDSYVINTEKNFDWYKELQMKQKEKEEEEAKKETLIYSKKHYLKKGLSRTFKVKR